MEALLPKEKPPEGAAGVGEEVVALLPKEKPPDGAAGAGVEDAAGVLPNEKG